MNPETPAELPPGLEAARQVFASDDLLARFTTAATATGVRVRLAAPGIADWRELVIAVLRETGAKSIWLPPSFEPSASDEALRSLVEALGSAGLEIRTGSADPALFDVDAAVVGVNAAIAETGSLVCESGAASPRGASLYPPLLIALLDVTQIVPDLIDCFVELEGRGELPSNVNIITGPSKTADIEGVLVTGVHGPGVVHAIVMERNPGVRRQGWLERFGGPSGRQLRLPPGQV